MKQTHGSRKTSLEGVDLKHEKCQFVTYISSQENGGDDTASAN